VAIVRVGTRGSRLALHQAGLVADALRATGGGAPAIVPISTVGDRDRRAPFAELGERGIFTKELEQALLDGAIDVAVHSAKDLTTEDVPGLALAAALPRADARDAWCGPHRSFAEVPQGARVGTASVRRTAQLLALRPDLQIEQLRGNVDTRLRKRDERGQHGIVLAACGLDRLGLAAEIGFRVDAAVMLPEAGQGFVVVQCRDGEEAQFAPLGEPAALVVLAAERAAVALLEGGCRTPVAAYAEPGDEGELWLRAWRAHPDGTGAALAETRGTEPAELAATVAAALAAAAA
jgi:hydroxymethylbilane synthase